MQMIHETHYLLFAVALVHIVYTCCTLYLSLFRVGLGGRLTMHRGLIAPMPAFITFSVSAFWRQFFSGGGVR
jgi:hypothetical protein